MLAVGRAMPRTPLPRGRGHMSRVPALCALLLIAPLAGWLGSALTASGGALVRSVVAAVPVLAGADGQRGAAPGLGARRPYSAPGAVAHEYWQVGLSAGPEARNADGMRTTIRTRLPEAVADRTTDYFWVGAYLADGSFIQVGYYVSWYDRDAAGWFYCAFAANGRKGPCVYGPNGSAGANDTTHMYALEVALPAGGERGGSPVWRALLDGKTVGRFAWTSDVTGANTPSVYAESSGFSPHPSDSQLGPVDFTVPLQVRLAGQTAYISAAHLRPVYNAPDVCPPYGVAADGHGGSLIGSGLACAADGEDAR